MWSELKTLFWLQWKLTRSMFRSRRTGDQLRIVGLLRRLLTFMVTLPMLAGMSVGLAAALILLSPVAAYELAMAVNVFMFFIWLVLPASYNSQMVERFEMSRLFPHPIRFRTIVVGSTLISMLTMTGMWTVPVLLSQVIGLAWHQPLALPLILVGALPTFALLVLTGRIMDDFFDLVAGDRRLRALVLALLSLPFIVCWLGQYAFQYAADDFNRLPQFIQISGLEELAQLDKPNSLGEFRSKTSRVLEVLRISRLLVWLPPGWSTAGMGLAVTGAWGRAMLFLAGSTAFVALLLWAHARITRRLMQGAALGIGAERVRSRRLRLRLPGPPAFWALFHKDWLYLWRGPLPRRLIFSALISTVAMLFPMRSLSQGGASPKVQEALPLIVSAFMITMISMVINVGMTANYFGSTDREGFATLAFSAQDRRHAILSANLAVTLFASALWLVLLLGISLLSRVWIALPLGLYLALCMQIGGMPAYNLAAIIGPYRAQLKFTRGRQRSNMWGMLAWAISAPPVLVLIVLPYIFWRPGLALTLPLGMIYSVGLYALTLKPLARLLQRREHDVLEAVTTQE
jgi:hypothetical protein